MKITIKTIITVLVLILLIGFASFKISGLDFNNSNYSWTKAICNETHCQDYEIYCNGNKLVKQIPITGAVISIDENWQEPRGEIIKERVCD